MTEEIRDLAADLALWDSPPEPGAPINVLWRCEGTRLNTATVAFREAARRALAAEAEVERLKAVIDGMAARIASQSDALSRTAEGRAVTLFVGQEGQVPR